MPCRCTRAVATLLALAAGLHAAEQIELRNGRGAVAMAVADELQIETPKGPLAVSAIGRAGVQATARQMLASGTARRAAPVVYLEGRVGDPTARAVASRQILLEAAPGGDLAALAAAHGLRLSEAVPGRPGWCLAEPISSDVYAAIDAARSLSTDPKAALAWLLLEMPVATRHTPDDLMISDGLAWHIQSAQPARMRPRQVWDYWRGLGANIAITDGGVQTDHLDLEDNYRGPLSYDYINSDSDPRPHHPTNNLDNHGTAVAGLILGVGDNGLGSCGVAFHAGMAVNKIFNEYADSRAAGLPVETQLLPALLKGTASGALSEQVWVNNCSWGPIDDAARAEPLPPFTDLALHQATSGGRNGRGTVFVFPAGNTGWINPNINRPPPPFGPYPSRQDNANFDAYLNRYVIPVGSYDQVWNKEAGSEHGSNLIIAAPGTGLATTDRTLRTRTNPTPAYDNKGYRLWPVPPLSSDLTGDGYIWGNGGEPYENGDFHITDSATSWAAALVSGTSTLMLQARPDLSWRDVRQIYALRGQDPLFYDPEIDAPMPVIPQNNGRCYISPIQAIVWGLSYTRPATVPPELPSPFMLHNIRYGFGGLDASRAVFGGDGEQAWGAMVNVAEVASAAARDEPGALRWPLLPALLPTPLIYHKVFLPITGTALDDTAIFDAPEYPPAQTLVPDGRAFVNDGLTRFRTIDMPITDVPDRFRVESVELKVVLRDVGQTTYPSMPTGHTLQGAQLGFRWSDYAFYLHAPEEPFLPYPGAILGRQRNDSSTTANYRADGQAFTWTFTEFRHINEIARGTWRLSIIDEVNSPTASPLMDTIAGNPPQCRVEEVELRIYGHQTYDRPRLDDVSENGVASDEGTQTIDIEGSSFGVSHGGITTLQAYWQPLLPVPGPPVEIPTTYYTPSTGRVNIPDDLTPAVAPGSGYIFLANPAVVVGRSDPATPPITDVFDGYDPFTPPDLMPTTIALPGVAPVATDRWMKVCPPGDYQEIKYSRRPTLTDLPDIVLKPGQSFDVSTVAFDPDVLAGLGTPAETLSVTVYSYNPEFLPSPPHPNFTVTQLPPAANGLGTYRMQGTPITTDSGFAFIQVQATDGVLTATRSFRIVIQTDEDGSGCGGGMGLALLGVPLAAWFIRRRRRS